ncbi:MAG: flagellar basal-body MS-ring/collar protein FliF [Pikeienuella sp.]
MNTTFSNLNRAWLALEPRKRAALVVSVMAAVVFLGLLIRIVATPTLSLLYSGLDSSAASGVIESLDRQGVQYEVRGDAIYVPADARDRVRIVLAGEGLPTAGAAGYELLDGLSGFGTTAEMFDTAYWRAKEGELARTLLAFNGVNRARVHIANTRRQPFERETQPTASVTVSTTNGVLSRQQAEAIRFLVASAVGGLPLTNVAVIDQEHGVILRSGDAEAETATGDEATQKAAELRKNVMRMLEARVGAGAAIVEVAVETTRNSETIRERTVDPNTRVIIHRDVEESTDAAEGEASAVSVASNLAEGDVDGGADQSSRQASRTRERFNYEVSEVLRESVRPAGDVRRVTVAVMVDGIRSVDADGVPSWTPRTEEELVALSDLVKSAVGYNEQRGDVVTIQTLEFSAVEDAGVVAEDGFARLLAVNVMSLIQIGVLAIVALMLGLFVIRPIMRSAAIMPPAADQATLLPPTPGPDGLIPGTGTTAAGEANPAIQLNDGRTATGNTGEQGAPSAPIAPPDQRALLETAVTENTDKARRVIGAWLDTPDPDQVKP